MILQFVLKSGATYKVSCKSFDFKQSGEASLYQYDLKGLVINEDKGFVKPSFVDLKEVAAVLRLTS